jgi:hypothetical protein
MGWVPFEPRRGSHPESLTTTESGEDYPHILTYAFGGPLRSCGLSAVDCNLECLTDLSHPRAAQRTDPFDQCGGWHRLDRVQIDGTAASDRIFAGVENDLTRQTSDRGRTRRNDRTTEPRDGCVTRQDHNWSSTDLRRFAPPQLTSNRHNTHVAEATLRNEARSPQSSSPSIG